MVIVDHLAASSWRADARQILSRNFATWSIVPPVEWVHTVRRVPDAHGATQPFRFDYAPYEREMFEECFNPRNQEVSFMLYSRGGKSEVVLNVIGYMTDQRPCRIGVMWPTKGQGEKWSKGDLMQSLIDPTECLSALIPNEIGMRRPGNTILHKLFPGGVIDIVGANTPGDLRRMKARVLYADEIDAIAEIESDEGDQLAILKKRGSEFADTIEIYCSYPSLKRRSRIEAKLLDTDFRQWFVVCAKCGGEPFVMHRNMLRYDNERPEQAMLECPKCGEFLSDAQRYEMMLAGNWKAKAWRAQSETEKTMVLFLRFTAKSATPTPTRGPARPTTSPLRSVARSIGVDTTSISKSRKI